MITSKVIENKHEKIYKPFNYTFHMNKWVEILLGLILIIVSITVAFYSQVWGAWNFWSAAGTFFKGGLFWFIVMIGSLFVLLGISDLRETNAPRPRPAPHPNPAPSTPVMQERPKRKSK